ncbi:MAG: substrate-binding domain-containing protein [Phycisphaerae bacterium]|nr:substrate-binding domain-containing protein [Phycisphaerae bacterium]
MATMMMPKSEQVYEDLREKVRGMRPGSRLPSIRSVMREFGVSQFTVDRAMERLAEEGAVVRQASRGVFVTEAAGEGASLRPHVIAIAVPDDFSSPVYTSYVRSLEEEVAKAGEAARVIRYDCRDRILQGFPEVEIDALIILPTSERLLPEDFAALSRFSVPTVIFGRVLRDVAIDCVEPDDELGGAMAAEHLMGLGHRRLAVLVSEPRTVVVELRVQGFCRQARMGGLEEVEVIECGTQMGQRSAIRAYETLRGRLKDGVLGFTGLFVVSDMSALGAIKALEEGGLNVPRDVSVIGFDGIPEGAVFRPPLTTVAVEIEAVARLAVEVVAGRFEGSQAAAIHRSVPPKVVVRESTQGVAS